MIRGWLSKFNANCPTGLVVVAPGRASVARRKDFNCEPDHTDDVERFELSEKCGEVGDFRFDLRSWEWREIAADWPEKQARPFLWPQGNGASLRDRARESSRSPVTHAGRAGGGCRKPAARPCRPLSCPVSPSGKGAGGRRA
jgi:hypothetical protein